MGILGDFTKGFVLGLLEADAEIKERGQALLQLGGVYISILKHITFVDGIIEEEEKDFFISFRDMFFEKNSEIANWEGISEELIQQYKVEASMYWSNPIPITTIKQITKGDTERRIDLFSVACYLAISDGKVNKSENAFLKSLAKELGISALDRDSFFREYGII